MSSPLEKLQSLLLANDYEEDDDLLEAVLRNNESDPERAAAKLSEMGFNFSYASFSDISMDDETDPSPLARGLSEQEELQKETYAALLREESFKARQLVFEQAAGPNPKRYSRLFLPVQRSYGGAIVGSKYKHTISIIGAVKGEARARTPAHLAIRFIDNAALDAAGMADTSCLMIEGVHPHETERAQELLDRAGPLHEPGVEPGERLEEIDDVADDLGAHD